MCMSVRMKRVWGPADVMRDADVFSYRFVSPLYFFPHPNPQILLSHTHTAVLCVCARVYVCLNGLSQAKTPG